MKRILIILGLFFLAFTANAQNVLSRFNNGIWSFQGGAVYFEPLIQTLNVSVRDGMYLIDKIDTNDVKIMPAYLNQTESNPQRAYRTGNEFDILTNDFVICGWTKVNGDNSEGFESMFGKGIGNIAGSYGVIFEISTRRMLLLVRPTDGNKLIYSPVIEYGDWHFSMIEIIQSTSTINFYFDNILLSSQSYTGTFPDLSSRYFGIGVRDFSGVPTDNRSWAGFSDIRIYKSTLTSQERLDLFNRVNEPVADIHYPCNNNIFTDLGASELVLTAALVATERTSTTNLIENQIGYSEYGSNALLNNGYELYRIYPYYDNFGTPLFTEPVYIPKKPGGIKLTTPLNYEWYYLDQDAAGSDTLYNMAEAKLDIPISTWDRSDTLLFNDNARVTYEDTTAHGYYDSTNTTLWHISELTNYDMYNDSKIGKNKKNYISATSDSWINPTQLDSIVSYNKNTNNALDQSILTNTNDINHKVFGLKAGVCFTFDDIYRADNWVQANKVLMPAYNWRATFMLNGDLRVSNPDYYLNMDTLIADGHGISNHTLNHIDWETYLETNTAEDFFNTEILPEDTVLTERFGFSPSTFSYAQVLGQDTSLNSYVLNNGFDVVRPVGFLTVNPLSKDLIYNGDNQALLAIYLSYFKDTPAGDAELIKALEYALKYNGVITFISHNIDLTNTLSNTFNVKLSRMQLICDFVVANGMTFYTMDELVPSLFE